MNEREARVVLSTCWELGDPSVGRAVRTFGAVTVVDALVSGSAADVGCREAPVRWQGTDPEEIAGRELGLAARLGVSVDIPGDPSWPTQLDDLGDRAPLSLRRLGLDDIRVSVGKSVAIVGARSCTRYGAELAQRMGADLAEQGCCVVSGGAFGIDANAHLGALAADGISVAITAGGVDEPSPQGNWRIFDRLCRTGAIISEAPLGMRPGRRHFLVRNRLIAALSRATVIVEAGRRSGAARTASEANSLGRVVAAVPGPVTSEMSQGCHRLIRNQEAVLVRGADDIMELITPLASSGFDGSDGSDGFDGSGQACCAAVFRELARANRDSACSVSSLARRLKAAESEVLTCLVSLREQGRVRESGVGWTVVFGSG